MINNFFLFLGAGLILVSCQIDSTRESNENVEMGLVDAKYSLAKDRSEFDKLRESIPVEVKKQNDEKALMAEWMGELKYAPNVIREKFNKLVRKKRELFNKDMTRSREAYNKSEKKAREEFLKNLADERKEFLNHKVDREKRADFFSEQDETRRTYFAEQRDKRADYESDIREKRKNFDDYIKEKTGDFNSELKDYTIRWKEKQNKENNLENQN